MEKRNLTCIGCPMGCALLVEMNGKEIISVTGNTCKKGAEYAVKEVTNPTRIVTTTVRVKNGSMPVVSVKTAQDIPKEKIFDCVEALRDVCVEAPGSDRRCDPGECSRYRRGYRGYRKCEADHTVICKGDIWRSVCL